MSSKANDRNEGVGSRIVLIHVPFDFRALWAVICEEMQSRNVDLEERGPKSVASSDELEISVELRMGCREVGGTGCAGDGVDEGREGSEGAGENEPRGAREGGEGDDGRGLLFETLTNEDQPLRRRGSGIRGDRWC